MGLVRDLITEYVENKHRENDEVWRDRVEKPHLHPSTLAFCNRKAILKAVEAFPDHPLYVEPNPDYDFDLYVKELMRDGNVWEDENAKALNAEQSHQLITDLWSGELDFLIGDPPTIVEHKTTATYNFRVRDRLPYHHHLVQVGAYQVLYERTHPEEMSPECRIYYQGRGHWGEFRVWLAGEEIGYEGEVDGNWRSGFLDFDVLTEMSVLETYWVHQELPPKIDDPFGHRFGYCVRGSDKKGWRPDCPWFDHCWPEMEVWNGMVQR